MSKHTGGEWSIEMYQKPNGEWYAMVWADVDERSGCTANPDICKVYAMGDGRKGELQANARLIAAAPDLLESLEEAWQIIQGWEAATPIQIANAADKARAVIAKARGE